jgi:hypothetical protein
MTQTWGKIKFPRFEVLTASIFTVHGTTHPGTLKVEAVSSKQISRPASSKCGVISHKICFFKSFTSSTDYNRRLSQIPLIASDSENKVSRDCSKMLEETYFPTSFIKLNF